MNDRELLELIATQVGSLTQEVGDIKKGLYNLEKKVDDIDKIVIRIENDNHIQHTALFDGWKHNTQQLERIENEVTKQEEIIMRRIK